MAPRSKNQSSKPVQKRLPPIGQGPIKRTPRHEFDHRDNLDNIYDVDRILAERSVKIDGQVVEEWLVRWKGFNASDDTWEPIENLAGLEDDIAKFRQDRDEQTTLKLGKRKRRIPHNSTTPVSVPAAPTATAVGAATSTDITCVSSQDHGDDSDDEDKKDSALEPNSDGEVLRPAMRGRRVAKVRSCEHVFSFSCSFVTT